MKELSIGIDDAKKAMMEEMIKMSMKMKIKIIFINQGIKEK